MNSDEILSTLEQLFSCYPNTEITKHTTAMYLRILTSAGITPAELQTVVDQSVARCKFLPTVAELLDTWHSIRNAGQLTWADAWDVVQKEMRRVGSYALPQFSDELTARVVKAMGWKTLCASEDAGIDRAQFRDMYNAMAARQEGIDKLLPQARELAERNGNGNLIPMRNVLGALTDSRNGSK